MIKYKTLWGNIDEVHVERETASFVFFPDGSKEKKDGGWKRYFDTRREAVNYIVSEAERKLCIAEMDLNSAKYNLNTLIEKYGEETKK